MCDVVDTHDCYVVDIGRTNCEQIHMAESITTDAGHFGHVGLSQLCTKL